MTCIRAMAPSELARIAEIDRSERITRQYRQPGEKNDIHVTLCLTPSLLHA